jgi:hypothetical protein
VQIKHVDEIKGRGVYKIRSNLIPSRYKLEMRFIRIEEEILYSYQLFTDRPVMRWDNAPHYPNIKTYPHHIHTKDDDIVESELKGNAGEDLQKVLSEIKHVLKEHHFTAR